MKHDSLIAAHQTTLLQHLLYKDLQKLGVDPNTPGVKGAIAALQRSVSGTIARAAGAAEE